MHYLWPAARYMQRWYSIKKAYGDASIFNTEADIKKAVNQKQSLEKFSTTGGVGAAVTLFVATGKTVGKYLSGELDEKEMIIEYDSAIAEIECQKKNYDIESSVQIGYLSKLEEKRDSLQERVNAKAQQTASAYGVSVSTLMSSFSSAGVVQDTSWDLMRFITDSRMRRRKEAEKVGYSEAKQLYEKKLKSLRDKLEQEKENASRQLKDYANLISKILAEIEDNQMKIADLEIALQEN